MNFGRYNVFFACFFKSFLGLFFFFFWLVRNVRDVGWVPLHILTCATFDADGAPCRSPPPPPPPPSASDLRPCPPPPPPPPGPKKNPHLKRILTFRRKKLTRKKRNNSFWVLGGGASPPNVPTEKICNLYTRASEASERLKNIYFQVLKYICIHTINAVTFYYLWHGAIYDSIIIKHYSLRKNL